MTSDQIRQQFIDFFLARNHKVVRSAPLVPINDPSLLFINAGMNQFKPIFLGLESPDYPRIVDAQRCMRVSGKHNDLEEVGVSPHHHTLFEMLGNWSFGDYYKRESIPWAWQLLTDVWKLPKDKLWVTVFKDERNEIAADTEAAEIWRNETDIDQDHILFFGRSDNFWEMGDHGPCGPCTEIHIDRGSDFCNFSNDPNHQCRVNGDCNRFIELWNLVFIQYDRKSSTKLESLPQQHVDTGMGLERICAVLQNAPSNYDTDLFKPIMDAVWNWAIDINDKLAPSELQIPLKVIADHSRAAAFLIADGVLPSNEWRGYVLRRIIRRAVRFGTKLSFNKPFLHKSSSLVIDKMGPIYPELLEGRDRILKIIEMEETRFFKTLNQAFPMVEELLENTRKENKKIIPGKEVFTLYDTYGFPVDITEEIAAESDLTIDFDGFKAAMEKQKNRARKSWVREPDDEDNKTIYQQLASKIDHTVFHGYEKTTENTTIKAIIQSGAFIDTLSNDDHAEIVIDPTPFYAESGGQIGDQGYIESEHGIFKVENTKWITPKIAAVTGKILDGFMTTNSGVAAKINETRRKSTARNHTATHILHRALKRVLGDHVKQSGSLVAPDRFRFDFTHFEKISLEEIQQIEEICNQTIIENLPVTKETMTIDEALNRGATALFDEKYADIVRVVIIPNYSMELCGGTHVDATGEIGFLKIVSESSIASGIRRIDALTGESAIEYIHTRNRQLETAANLLKVSPEELPERIDKLQSELKQLNKLLEKLKAQQAQNDISSAISSPKQINGIQFIASEMKGLDMKQLRNLSDRLRDQLGSGVVVLASSSSKKVFLTATVSKDLIPPLHAGELISKLAKIVGGGGGGRPDMAQAGGSHPEEISKALKSVGEIIQAQFPKKES